MTMQTVNESGAPMLRHAHGSTPADFVSLLRDGRVRCRLFRLPWQSAELLLEPADELLHYLERSFGARVPTGDHDAGERRPDDDAAVRLALRLDVHAELDREEFELRVEPDLIQIRARTVQAISHGIYDFLERYVGIRWLWPGSSGEVVPSHRDLDVPLGKSRRKPDYRWRAIRIGGPVYQAMDLATMLHAVLRLPRAYQVEFDRWCRRNRLGGLSILDGHRWAEIAPPEAHGKRSPHYYALVNGHRDTQPGDGKHGNQPCLSNPAVDQLMLGHACAWIAAEPSLDAVSIALNDGGSPCQCDPCRAEQQRVDQREAGHPSMLDEATNEDIAPREPRAVLTDQLFRQTNGIAKRFRALHPDKKLLILLYSYFSCPPATHRLADNVIGQYCMMASMFWHPSTRRQQLENVRRMGAAVPEFGIYEYYANGAWPGTHRLFPSLVHESVRSLHAAGARYFQTQPPTGFAINGLNLYMLARCLWNVQTDPDEVIRDYCRAGFGMAAMTIESYFRAWMNRWRETESGVTVEKDVPRMPKGLPKLSIALLYSATFLDDREAELADALAQCEHDETVQLRIEWLGKGLDYTRRYAEACRASLTLLALTKTDQWGLPVLSVDADQMEPVVTAARAADAAWQAYWDAAEKYLGQFVYDDFWAHYRTGPFGQHDQLRQRIRQLIQQVETTV